MSGSYLVIFLTPENIKTFLKNVVLGQTSVPTLILNGITNENELQIAEGIKEVYERAGILKVINTAGYYGLKMVLYLGDKVTKEREELNKSLYVNFPLNEDDSKKLVKKFKGRFKGDKTLESLAIASIYTLFLKNSIYLSRGHSGVIKVICDKEIGISDEELKKLEDILRRKL